jgi:hypothetical protein
MGQTPGVRDFRPLAKFSVGVDLSRNCETTTHHVWCSACLFFYNSSSSTMVVPLNLKLERQQRFPHRHLLFFALIITALLSSLTRLHDLPYSECSSSFSDADVAITLLPLFISSPAVESTSLASQQSYGVFNDIPDQRWELMRKRAHEEHMYVQKDVSSMPKIRHDNPIIKYLSNLEVRK